MDDLADAGRAAREVVCQRLGSPKSTLKESGAIRPASRTTQETKGSHERRRDGACGPDAHSLPFAAVRLWLKLLAVPLALSMSPGLVELVDDATHYVLEGRTDHAEGEDACPEHGCAPSSHHCGCCTSIAMVATSAAVHVRGPLLRLGLPVAEATAAGPAGVRTLIERPPTA